MSDENKPSTQFIPEKSSGNTEKYKTITTGVRTGTAEPAEISQETSVDTEALHQEMKEKVASSLGQGLAEALSNPTNKAVQYGVIGAGHGGSRLAEQFYQFGYRVCVTNTSQQDLYHINLPQDHKYFMDYALGGAGKDMDIGGAAAQECEQDLLKLFNNAFGQDLGEIDAIVLCVGGGGGTGTGSCIPLVSMLSDYGLPITVVYTLPMSNEGTMTKANAIEGLDRLSQLSVNKLINGLVIIDNSRIESLYADISLGGFFKVANFDIANIFNTFNTLSSLPTQYSAIDPMDLTRIMTSGNCTIYGKIEIPLYIEDGQVHMTEDDIADLLMQNLQDGLLAEGFDVSEAIRAGIYITGKNKYLTQIPASTFNYAFASLNDELKSADLFKGIYSDERLEDKLVIYALISGVGLPRERVEALKYQSQQDVEEMEDKEHDSKTRMEVFQKTIASEQDKYKQKKRQNSTFGRMVKRRRGRN